MTLSEYLNMLFPFFGDRKGFGATPKTKKGRGKADFVTFILGAIVEEDWETECPVLDLQAGTLRKILSGASPFSAINAIPLITILIRNVSSKCLAKMRSPLIL